MARNQIHIFYSSVCICVLVAHLLPLAVSEMIPYNQHYIVPLNPEYLTIPKFSPTDAPHWAPGRGRSYIDLSRITLHNDCKSETHPPGIAPPSDLPCLNSTFDILMFEEPSDQYWMNYWPEKQFCCTADMVTEGDCFPEQLNKLIVPIDLPGAFPRSIMVSPDMPVSLNQDGIVAHHDIKKSGIYILFMGVCDPNSPSLRISGTIDSLDPYGYLPADLFGNLPFYGALSLMYTVVGIIWLAFCACHSLKFASVTPLSEHTVFSVDDCCSVAIFLLFWITLVLALGMMETTVLFAQYLNWNDDGSISVAVTFLALIFGVFKRAVSRVVVLLVTLGYGVVRPTLGSQMGKVLAIGLSYFVLSLYYTIFNSLPARNKHADDPYNTLFSLSVFLLAGVDTTFYCWVFLSINNILTGLAVRKQAAKYVLYKNFRTVLFISLMANCVWVLYGSAIHLNTETGEDSNWKDRWTVDALWEITYFLIFVAIAIMWAPSKNFSKYAYSVELSQLDDDAEYNQTGIEAEEQTEQQQDQKGDTDDAEYGGRLNDEDDPYNNPYKGKGALDPLMAGAKKQ